MRKFILIILLFSIPAVLFSQRTGSIQGKVTDQQTDETLHGATVILKSSGITVLTSRDGAFVFSALNASRYVLLISHVGYETIEWPVTVREGETAQAHVSMAPDSRPGSEVVVTASRMPEKITAAPAPIQIISAKDITHFAGSNVGELVSRVQGVEYTRSGVDEITFNARGLHSAFNIRVLQLVDGRNTMAAASGSLPMFNNGSTQKDDIDRIEILQGPQTALYGPNAHNALFNYITKDPRKYPGTTVSVSAGSQYQFSSRIRHAGIVNSKFAFKITGEHATGQDYKWYDTVYVPNPNLQTAIGIPERISDFTFKRIRGEMHAYYKVLPQMDFIVSGGGSQFTRLQVTTSGRNQMRDMTYGFLQARLVNPRFFATVYNTWGNLGASVILPNYTRDFYNSTRPGPNYRPPEEAEIYATRLGNRVKERSQRLNAEGQYNYSFSKAGLRVVAGASYQIEIPNGYGVSLVDKLERIRVTQYGAVLQVEKNLPWNLRFVGATRLDHHSNFGDFLAPRLALVKSINEGSFRVTWGKAYSMPSLLNQYAGINGFLFGNGGKGIKYIPVGASLNDPESIVNTEPLKPELVRTWEAGYRGRVTEELFADVNYYNGTSEQFISPAITVRGRAVSVNGIPVTHSMPFAGTADANGKLQSASFLTFFNYGKVKIYGADLGMNYTFSKFVGLGVKYSWFDSDITENNKENDANGDGFVSSEERSLNAPRHLGMALLDIRDLLKQKLFITIATRWIEQYDFYSGNQIGTAAGKGKRGIISIPNGLPLLKNFDWGPLGGFTTVDLQAGYQFTTQSRVNLGITNLFNTEQIEFVGSPSIGRLIMVELKVHLPGK
ncbi:MAG TPA: TonB-dependent receptor [Flavisolibacter sp.]|jgi:iron complex outermembrane receptor protein|nr:TonB-dependent receptor [Flavisolibacter sp.]